jgi:hypothetical protein
MKAARRKPSGYAQQARQNARENRYRRARALPLPLDAQRFC